MSRGRLAAGTWVVALACVVVLPAAAGEIHGTLSVPARSVRQTPHAYPGRASSLPVAHATVIGAVWDAIVYVDAVPAGTPDPAAGRPRPRLVQKNQAFVPRVLAVKAGTTVDFPNMDVVFHNVFSVSPTKRFDLGKYARGQSRAVTFSKPGLVKVYCDIHSDMAAFLYVLPHGHFTRPDEAGFFSLPALPAGVYRLRVWHPDLGERESRVEVPEHGTVSVELGY